MSYLTVHFHSYSVILHIRRIFIILSVFSIFYFCVLLLFCEILEQYYA